MSELLAVRDGEGTVWAREHIEACQYCRHELDLLYRTVSALRALPAHRPPRDRWGAVRAEAVRERRGRVLRRTGWGSLAVAAGIALLIGVRSVGVPGAAAGASPELEALMTQSRDLEAALQTYDPDGRVLNARAAGIIADLEDRIALVDAGIYQVSTRGGSEDQLVGLWRDRVELMDALVNVHVTRAAYVGF
jgi:hypothetical protein